jgi:hypothetical protein
MGGKHLEDVQIAKEWKEEYGQWAPGYSSWEYSPEKKKRLWKLSEMLVGENAYGAGAENGLCR